MRRSAFWDIAAYGCLTVMLTALCWCLWTGVGQAAEYSLILRFAAESPSETAAASPEDEGDAAVIEPESSGVGEVSGDTAAIENEADGSNQADEPQAVKLYQIDDSLVIDGVPYESEGPLVPLRLLAAGCEAPLVWRTTEYGGAALWCREGGAAAIIPGKNRVYTAADTVSYKTVYERPVAASGSIWLPVSALPVLGLDYELDWANRRLTVTAPPPAAAEPETVWEQLAPSVETYLKPQSRLLARAVTKFDPKQQNRSHNLLLAASALHGRVIEPGQSFSFNQAVGQRTPARGYKKAIIFVNKKQVYDYGGGVCQVSTTLYQAAKQAGLRITERHAHGLPVSYAAAGQDATVAWGAKDLRFVNNSSQPLYLVTRYAAGSITVEIWQGKKPAELPSVLPNGA